jgi:hypothetical protein
MLSTIAMLAAQQKPRKAVVQLEAMNIARTYSVGDLAVWSENGKKFDASILIALLKSRVNPDQWKGNTGINPYAANAAIVVNSPQDTHEAIADILSELRKN